MGDFVIHTARKLFWGFDKIIFGLIDDVYGLLLQLARTSIFSQEVIHEFAQRVYALAGIFMLFKVSISIMSYILNPDDMSNNEKGLGKIVKNVILSLVMVVLVPYLFREAYDLQSIILEENTIMNLVFGTPPDDSPSNSSYADSAGSKIQFTLLYAFAQPNYDDFAHDRDFDLIDCKYAYETDESGNYLFRDKPIFDGSTTSSGKSRYIYELRKSCWGTYNAETDTYGNAGENDTNGQLYLAFKEGIGDGDGTGDTIYQNYAQGVAQQSFALFFKKDVVLSRLEDGRYLVDYKFGISTAVGLATLYLLLIFCIDIAVRSLKLGFLEMIAPVPIIAFCDPKGGKSMFDKWVKMCKNTYLDLFLRLFALYFGIYVISLVGSFRDVVTGDIVDNAFVIVFMIIGVLIFVKQLPKIISDSLGIDLSGKFEPNIFKKVENEALGGKVITGAAKGVVAGAAAGTAAAAANLYAPGKGGRVFGAGAGFASAFTKGFSGGIRGDKFGKNFSNSFSAAMKNKQSRADRLDDNVKWHEMMGARIDQAVGKHTKQDAVNAAEKHIKTLQDAYGTMMSQAEAMDKGNFDVATTRGSYSGSNSKIKQFRTMDFNGIKDLKKFQEQIKAEQLERESGETDAHFMQRQREHQEFTTYVDDTIQSRLTELATGKRIDGSAAADTGDGATDRAIRDAYRTMQAEQSAFNSMIDNIDSGVGHIGGTAPKDINGSSKGASARLSVSDVRQREDKIQQYGGKKDQK